VASILSSMIARVDQHRRMEAIQLVENSRRRRRRKPTTVRTRKCANRAVARARRSAADRRATRRDHRISGTLTRCVLVETVE